MLSSKTIGRIFSRAAVYTIGWICMRAIWKKGTNTTDWKNVSRLTYIMKYTGLTTKQIAEL